MRFVMDLTGFIFCVSNQAKGELLAYSNAQMCKSVSASVSVSQNQSVEASVMKHIMLLNATANFSHDSSQCSGRTIAATG
jgi:hypothetical protein